MSTRRERANRWGLRCPRCDAWKARHLIPPGLGSPGVYACEPTATRPTIEPTATSEEVTA